MILIAIVLLILGNFAPKWILKRRYIEFQDSFSWKSSLLKFSGMATCLLLALSLTIGVTLTSKDRFVLNKNAIYGLEFSKELKAIGFENGDRIIFIDENEIDRVSDIIEQILFTKPDVKVEIIRKDIHKTLIINENDIYTIINSRSISHVKAKMQPDSILGNNFKEVEISESRFGILNAFENFNHSWKYVISLIIPQNSSYNDIGGFPAITRATNIQGYLMILTLNLIFIAILNFIPLPGFNFGNFIVSVLENYRKKYYNKRLIKIIKIISIGFVIILILINITIK